MRPQRIHIPGMIFHITARGNNHIPIFPFDPDKQDYLFRLQTIFAEDRVQLLAYCLMSNHLHLLAQDVMGTGLAHAMQRLQGGYAQSWNRKNHRTGPIYDGRYKAKLIERDAHLLQASLYIHLNPVTAGLVTMATDYPWSSVAAYLGSRSKVAVAPDLPLELCGGKTEYRRLLDELEQMKRLEAKVPETETTIIRGLAIEGSDEFAATVEPVVERRAARRKEGVRPNGVQMDLIWKEVEKQTGIGREVIAGSGRKQAIAEARALFCTLSLREGISSAQIAQEIKRSRAGVYYLTNATNGNGHSRTETEGIGLETGEGI